MKTCSEENLVEYLKQMPTWLNSNLRGGANRRIISCNNLVSQNWAQANDNFLERCGEFVCKYVNTRGTWAPGTRLTGVNKE